MPRAADSIPMTVAYALTCAGSDPSGGAGIQVDLRTFAALDVWGLSAITALTAQTPAAVRAAAPVDPGTVAAQLEALLEAFPVGAAKTGMLATAAVCTAVADALPDDLPLVVDPVMVATSGGRLLDPAAVSVLVERLLPRAALLTPNLGEAAALVGRPVRTIKEMRVAADLLRGLGARAVLGRQSARNPLASPIYAELSGLPPMLVHVGADEVLRDDSTRLVARARQAGVDAQLEIWPCTPHAWQLMSFLPEARQSRAKAIEFLKARVAQAPFSASG